MPDCRIHCEIAAKLNFAAHQSAFPVLRELRVENLDARERIDDLTLTLRANPAFVREKKWAVDRIEPGGLVTIGDRDLEVDGGFLLGLTESVRGDVGFRLEQHGETVAELSQPVELLAYNEWGGAGFMPELLAAFSMPNDPAVDRILRSASEVLRRSGKKDQIDGYESRSRQRVWEIASAIYTAICNLGLAYAIPPSSFERDGQKIRVPSQMLDGKVGTCLDTAMLFTAAFEQAGLNPVVALPRGHALAGVWLQPEGLSTVVVDEAEILRKRIGLDELALVETTCVTAQPAPSFSVALKTAEDSIRLDDDGAFEAALDIRQARAHRITPLGSRSKQPAPDGDPSFMAVEQTLEEAPALPDFDTPDPEEEETQTPRGRLERWQRRLLDLSIRNPSSTTVRRPPAFGSSVRTPGCSKIDLPMAPGSGSSRFPNPPTPTRTRRYTGSGPVRSSLRHTRGTRSKTRPLACSSTFPRRSLPSAPSSSTAEPGPPCRRAARIRSTSPSAFSFGRGTKRTVATSGRP